MAWITPKTNWTPADPVDSTALNRIEGNAQYNKDTETAHEDSINPHALSGDASITYNGSNVSQITVKNLSGVTTTTITPTYSGDVMVGYVFNGGGKTITCNIAYDGSGNAYSITRR